MHIDQNALARLVESEWLMFWCALAGLDAEPLRKWARRVTQEPGPD